MHLGVCGELGDSASPAWRWSVISPCHTLILVCRFSRICAILNRLVEGLQVNRDLPDDATETEFACGVLSETAQG
jgi:hypothetical protein